MTLIELDYSIRCSTDICIPASLWEHQLLLEFFLWFSMRFSHGRQQA